MEEKRTSTLNNGLIWFGAAVSIAEILTGTFFAPLGFKRGLEAILFGHLIGCVLFFLAGLIGGQTRKSAMETVKMSFGEKGSILFSGLNVLQLLGWTAIMIITGARATATVTDPSFGFSSKWLWCIVIGVLIIVWLLIGIKNLGKLNIIAMTTLFIMTLVLSVIVFRGNLSGKITDAISFGGAVELAVAMPLSWLPLISDYTREAKKPFQATAASAIIYFFTSSWMYIIGIGLAIFTGESDISKTMLKAGIGLIGVIIIILATVTTTFMDAYSAGVSSVSIYSKLNEKKVAVIVCILGIILAMFTPIEKMTDFLYLIGSVFAPMIAIQIADYFIMKKEPVKKDFDLVNIIIWVAGFVIYRYLMKVDTPFGCTLPDMIITIIICLFVQLIKRLGVRTSAD